MQTPTLLLIPIAALFLQACGGSGEAADNDSGKLKPLVIGDDAPVTPETIYQMPTPNELFSLVREMAGDGQKRILNPASNVDRLIDRNSKAVNFGIYATDLVYASYFGLKAEVVRYYLTVKKVGEQIGVASAFDERDLMRLERNLTHGDSLEVISNETYYKAYEKLQEDEMGHVLALVLAGGWVESVHLVIQQVHDFDPKDPLIIRLAEQKFALEHLIDLMESRSDDKGVDLVRRKLIAIRDVYDRFEMRRAPVPEKSASGRMVLGDQVQLEITRQVFEGLKNAIELLRNELIDPEVLIEKTNA